MRKLSRDAHADYGIVGSVSVEVISISYVGLAGGLIHGFLCDRRAALRLQRTGTDLGHSPHALAYAKRVSAERMRAQRFAEEKAREPSDAKPRESGKIPRPVKRHLRRPPASAARLQK